MKRNVLGITLSFLLIIVNSCKHEPPEPYTATLTTTFTAGATSTTSTTSTTASTGTPIPINDSVCFNTQIRPLFNSSCAMTGCHDAITHSDGYNLTSYTGIKLGIVAGNPSGGKIMREINRNSMPQPPVALLTAEQKALLTRWINEGATNRQCIDLCNPGNATFAVGVNPILITNCVGCHNDNLASGGINLSNYNSVKATVTSGKLLCSITHGSGCSNMPQNTSKLNDNCIKLIQNWINNGALNN